MRNKNCKFPIHVYRTLRKDVKHTSVVLLANHSLAVFKKALYASKALPKSSAELDLLT